MDGWRWMAVVGVLGVFVFMAAHWASGKAAGRKLGRLVCYVVGCVLIGLLFGLWCAVAGAWMAWLAWWVVLGGCGLGTLAAYGLDKWDGRRTRR